MITQGKWIVGPRSKTNIISTADNRFLLVARCAGQRTKKEHEANARLIASAPDLLAACIRLYEKFENYNYEDIPAPIFNLIQNQIAEAINKSEGK